MIRVGVIGIGNAGNQVAVLANEKLQIPVLAINSSDTDLANVPDGIPKKLISSKNENGSGKDRDTAKEYLSASIAKLLSDKDIQEMLTDLDVVYVVSSTGGGTGSGTAPSMCAVINEAFPDVKTILVGILPVYGDALSSHVNTLQYLEELYNVMGNQTYMLYDNDAYAGMSSPVILNSINFDIVSDIEVMRGFYNHSTRYDSIDSKDGLRLLSFPGRLLVSRVEGIKEKDVENTPIEKMIIENIKKNSHVEAQRDKRCIGSGIILNISQTLMDTFNDDTPEVREFMGEAIHAFKHIYVNEDRKMDNNVFMIFAGLSPINDKIDKIKDRADDLDEKQKLLEAENSLDAEKLKTLSSKIANQDAKNIPDKVDVGNILNRFKR